MEKGISNSDTSKISLVAARLAIAAVTAAILLLSNCLWVFVAAWQAIKLSSKKYRNIKEQRAQYSSHSINLFHMI